MPAFLNIPQVDPREPVPVLLLMVDVLLLLLQLLLLVLRLRQLLKLLPLELLRMEVLSLMKQQLLMRCAAHITADAAATPATDGLNSHQMDLLLLLKNAAEKKPLCLEFCSLSVNCRV